MRDRQLHEDHHSDDRDAGRRYVQMIDEVHLDETDASGSRDFPCRAVFLRPLPKRPPHEGALSSNELPAKPTRGGWGPRYLVSKRERGPVRVPSSLTEDEWRRPLMSSFWNHERTWLRLTP